jgi:hypothetical protein
MSLRNRLLISLHLVGLLLPGIVRSEEIGLLAADAYQPRFDFLPPVIDVIPRGGFYYGIGLNAAYDTNFFLEESDEDQEFSLAIVPSIRYRSDADNSATAWFEFEYAPSYQMYLENSDLNNFQQNFGGSLNLKGSRTSITVYGRYNEVSGSDRLSDGFVEGNVMHFGVVGTYQVASRTSIGANIGYSKSDYSTGQEGADTISVGLSGNWSYSERLGFGPYVRYSTTSSDSAGTRDSFAFLIQANYLFGERIRINGSLGVEHADDVGLTGDLTASYVLTERMNLSASVRYATVPSPSEDDYFVQDLTVSTQLTRQLTYGTIGIGVNWSTSFYEEVEGEEPVEHDNDMYTSIALSYSRDFFSERVQFESSIAYSFSQGESEYDRWLFSVGVSMTF